jgi:predicted dehydrogenase
MVIKASVIGAGYIAREHLACLTTLDDVRVEAVCDRSAVMAEATAEQFGASGWFTDHREMLRSVQPDVVHVTTPPQSHALLAADALRSGAHVLVEKPIVADRSDLPELQNLARERGRHLLEDYNYLFSPAVRRIGELLARGDLGEVVHVEVLFCVDLLGAGSRHADPNSPHAFVSMPGGPVADFITHLAYLAEAFVGEFRSVDTVWSKRETSSPLRWDEFRALIDAERGTASVGFSARSQPDVFWLRVHGTRLRASASLFEPLLTIEKLHGGPRPLLPVRNGFSLASAYARSAVGGLWHKLAGRPVTYEGLWELLRRFYGALGAGEGPPISPRQISAVNRLVWELLEREPNA